ncbi:Mth938-like domain-containing protein [Palleronia abyssalis]|uniref:Uncharacterized protein n=1 Tax=Palleronia abyssalis TaxID=1501240 RepID=A0A2R8BUC4_9RHOB|nr:Mth938-like domain-containing protein [Palleronia abyssalis]SPJ23752.1 hypothetical protein PAA8504_01567 [Palleronia abyssalis]
MELNPTEFMEGVPIDGYGTGFFRVGGEVHEGAMLLLPSGRFAWSGFDAAPILAARDQIDIMLIGTGPEMTHIPRDFRDALDEAGIGVESMASGQGCRTYNVLLGEGRRIGAALLPT